MNNKLLTLVAICLLTISCAKTQKDKQAHLSQDNNQSQNTTALNIPTYKIPKQQADYYKEVDFTKTGPALLSQLAYLLEKTHNPISYTPGIRQALQTTDQDPENKDNVVLLYGWPKGESNALEHQRSINKRYFSKGEQEDSERKKVWEREHVFAKSRAKSNTLKLKGLIADAKGSIPHAAHTRQLAGQDVHHITAINGYWNNHRNNSLFVNGEGNSHKIANYWYPGDEWKGDVARMMMYMHLRYHKSDNYTSADKIGLPIDAKQTTKDGMIDLFLKWNAEDPVSEIEVNRNKYHGNLNNKYAQGNRNPFIDNPYLANQIWGMPQYTADNLWK
ncbi:endonuclease I family protein [Myroides sp. LoEW2-1]|uniref:endonuclease I family protein n=1 Tax=Myroides sp. LoEW2-1 TaxID=2683192 RepID=UPI0013207D45|nr:endonuclease [Myroides sp. LoEW2-1]MVX37101.1 endonuclease [Myroides sp. LoEW2-1]